VFCAHLKYFASSSKFGYIETKEHGWQHTNFKRKVMEFQDKFEQTPLVLSIEVMFFLSDWLKNHIQGSDKKFSACFNSNGLK